MKTCRISILLFTIAISFIFSSCLSKEKRQLKGNNASSNPSESAFFLKSINLSFSEIGFLPLDAKEDEYCGWLEKYTKSINSKLVESSDIDKEDYKIVGYAK